MPELEVFPGVREIEHTADLGIEVVASSLAELFHRAAAGTMAVVRTDGAEGESGLDRDRRTTTGAATGASTEAATPGAREAAPPPASGPRASDGTPRLVDLDVGSDDVGALLVRWLRELLFLQEVVGFVYAGADFERLDASGLRARIRPDPRPTAPVRELKGVTYHGLDVRRDDAGWRALVIFDI